MASQSPANDLAADGDQTSTDFVPGVSTSAMEDPLWSPGGDGNGDDADPTAHLEQWNSPRINTYRFVACNFSMFILGMHDGCIGALIPYIGPYYDINYTTISTVFVVPFFGYVIAALSNNWIHHTIGQRGIAFIAPVCRLIGYIPIVLHPPFPVLPIALFVTAIGNGVEDSAYNAWVGNMQSANELLGLLHGSYGLGATVSPLIASAMVTKGNLPWYMYYYIMIGVVCVELFVGVSAFWTATGAAYRERIKSDSTKEAVTMVTVLRNPVTWLISLFLLAYVGAEVSLGGWIPTFMIEVRHVSGFLAGLTETLFFLGLTLGRVILGFVTGRIGEKLAILCYALLCIVMQLLYWLVPHFVAAIIFVILLGFFLGPLFPAAIVAVTKLLPPEYHVSAIGFAASFGGSGSAIIPFLVGAIAQSSGVAVLQPIVVAILVFLVLSWLLLPGGFEKGGLEKARDQEISFASHLKTLVSWVPIPGRAKAIRLDDERDGDVA